MLLQKEKDCSAGEKKLIEAARLISKNAYCPYSHYHVGAALLCADGSIYTGCNIENISYSPAICGERTAFCEAVSDNQREFRAIAVIGYFETNHDPQTYSAPCGVCRQVMNEFCDPDMFQVILANEHGDVKKYKLKELLPESFSPRR